MILSVKEIFGGRGSEQAQTGARSYRRQWRVITTGMKCGPKQVREAVPVSLGDPYEYGEVGDPWYEKDDNSLAIKIAADERDPDGKGWIVSVDYGLADPADFGGIDDPTLAAPKKTWRGNRTEEIVDIDVEGRPIVNSAGDPFDPPITRPRSKGSLVVVRNERTYDDLLASAFRDRVNEFEFFGLEPGTVLCVDISAESAFAQSIGEYYVVTYEFEHEPKGWNPQVLDRGLRKLNATTGDREQIQIQGSLATSPVLLDGLGAPLAEERVADGEAIYLDFSTYESADFGEFGFEE